MRAGTQNRELDLWVPGLRYASPGMTNKLKLRSLNRHPAEGRDPCNPLIE